MKRWILLLLLPFSIPLTAQQQTPLASCRTSSYFTYVYKISAEEVKKLFLDGKEYNQDIHADTSFFHSLVDSFPTDKPDSKTRLPEGNYLLLQLDGVLLKAELWLQNRFKIVLLNDKRSSKLLLLDGNGRQLNPGNFQAFLNTERLKPDAKNEGFEFSKKLSRGDNKKYLVFVQCGELLIVREIVNDDYRRRIRPFRILSFPVRMVIYPLRYVYWHLGRTTTGYVATNKPKYLPGDTIKIKGYFVHAKGRPCKKTQTMTIWDQYQGTAIIRNAKIKPTKDGSYIYEFIAGDTLKLNTKYYVQFSGAPYYRNSFMLEDYQLDETFYDAKMSSSEYRPDEKPEIILKGTDASGLPLLDAYYKISIFSNEVKDVFQDQVFIPDTLCKLEGKLESQGLTRISIPDSLFPLADVDFKCKVRFLNSNNEAKEEELTFTKNNDPFCFETTDEDSFFMIRNCGKQAPRFPVWLITYTGKKDGPKDDPEEKQISLPHREKWNPVAENYMIRCGESERDMIPRRDYNSHVDAEGLRTNDSATLTFSNPRRLRIFYEVYRDKQLIQKEETDAAVFTFSRADASNASYYLFTSYVWGNKLIRTNALAVHHDGALRLHSDMPDEIYPGQEQNVKLKLTDRKDKPVSGANLTAWSVNAQFKENNHPTLPQWDEQHKTPRGKKRNYSLKALGENSWNDFIVPRNWQLKKMGADTMLFYQFRYPRDGIFVYKAPSRNPRAEFFVHVYERPWENDVFTIHIDDRLTFYSNANGQRYSVVTEPGVHSIRIRTRNREISIKNVELQAYSKAEMSLDLHELLLRPRPEVSIKFIKPYLRPEEISELNKSLIRARAEDHPHNSFFMKNGDSYFNFSDRWGTNTFGPINNSHFCEVYEAGELNSRFSFEPGFQYSFKSNTVTKNVAAPIYKEKKKQYLHIRRNGPGLGELAWTHEEITAKPRAEKASPFMQIYVGANDARHGTLWLKHDLKENLYGVALYEKARTNVCFLYKYANMGALTEGSYYIQLITTEGLASDIIPVDIKAGGRTYYRLKNLKLHRLDSSEMLWKRAFAVETMTLNKLSGSDFYTSSSEGIITGSVNNENVSLAYAHLRLLKEGKEVAAGLSSATGNFTFKEPLYGIYSLEISMPGYDRFVLGDIKPSYDNFHLIRLKGGSDGQMTRPPASSLSARSDGTMYYIDGVRVLPARGVNSVAYGYATNLKSVNISSGRRYKNRNMALTPRYLAGGSDEDGEADNMFGSNSWAFGDANISVTDTLFSAGLDEQDKTAKGIRDRFADYAFWQPELITDKKGEVNFQVKFPDNVTSWETVVLGMQGKRSLFRTKSTRAYKKLMVNLSLPRFMVEGDVSFATGKILNYTGKTYALKSMLHINGQLESSRDTTVDKLLVESFMLKAENKDTIGLLYQLNLPDGYTDGEKENIPVYPAGLMEHSGAFIRLPSNDTSFRIAPDPGKGPLQFYVQANSRDVMLQEIKELIDYPYECNEQLASRLIALMIRKRIRTGMEQRFNEHTQARRIIRKLLENRNEEGCWSWWNKGPTVPWMTAHVLYALHMAGIEEFETEDQQQALISMRRYAEYSKNTAYRIDAAMALKRMKVDFVEEAFLAEIDFDKLPLYRQMQVLFIVPSMSRKTLWSHKKESMTGATYWGEEEAQLHHNSYELTALAYEILKQDSAKNASLLPSVRQFFFEKRGNRGWRNTYESSKILAAIAPDVPLNEFGFSSSVEVQSAGSLQKIDRFPFEAKYAAGTVLTVNKKGKDNFYLGYSQTYFNPLPEKNEKYFRISSSFESKGKQNSMIQSGEDLVMVVDLNVSKLCEYVMLEVPIPAGCSYGNNLDTETGVETHRQYLKDRTLVFFESLAPGHHIIRIRLQPRYKGNYTLNPAKASLMYFPVFYGNNEMRKTEIR